MRGYGFGKTKQGFTEGSEAGGPDGGRAAGGARFPIGDHHGRTYWVEPICEVIRRCGPWRGREDVELATLEWVDGFNRRRLLEPFGNIPLMEFEEAYYRSQEAPAIVAGLNKTVSGKAGPVHTIISDFGLLESWIFRPVWSPDQVPTQYVDR